MESNRTLFSYEYSLLVGLPNQSYAVKVISVRENQEDADLDLDWILKRQGIKNKNIVSKNLQKHQFNEPFSCKVNNTGIVYFSSYRIWPMSIFFESKNQERRKNWWHK